MYNHDKQIDYTMTLGDLLKVGLAILEAKIDQGLHIEYSITPQELMNGRKCKMISYKVVLEEKLMEDSL